MKVKDTFAGYLQNLENRGFNKKTIGADKLFLEQPIAKAIGEREIETLRLIDASSVMAAGRKHGEYGEQRAIVVLRKLVRYWREAGVPSPQFHFSEVATPKVPKKPTESFSREEFDALLEAIGTSSLERLRTSALMMLLFTSGIRIGEAAALKKEDVDWDGNEITITNVKTKDRGEKAYLSPESKFLLRQYLDARHDDLPNLFVSGRAGLMTQSARNRLREYTKDVKLKNGKKVRFHTLRKTFVTTLLENGGDIVTVQNLARHKSPRTTLKYYAAANIERSKLKHQEIMGKIFGGPSIGLTSISDVPQKPSSFVIVDGNTIKEVIPSSKKYLFGQKKDQNVSGKKAMPPDIVDFSKKR